jgi:alpha-beta hydrolase superfamily lysophospholipase
VASYDHRLWMFHRRWEPPPEMTKVQATPMIVHGTVDHSGVYAEKLVSVGVAVFAQDVRGWGLSDGECLCLDDMDTFVTDVEALYQQVHAIPRYKNVKARFLLGKSLGGTVTAYCAAKYPQHWTGLLRLSVAYELDPKRMPSSLVLTLLNGLASVLPKLLPIKRLMDEHLIVSDEKALQVWIDDPLCSKDQIRLGYVVVFLHHLQRELPQSIVPQIELPMLIMCGDADQVVTRSGPELMISSSRPTDDDKQLKVYKGGYHNLLQEPSLKTTVMTDIQEWILAHA